MSHQENADRIKIEKLTEKAELLKQLGTRIGFFNYFFKIVQKCSTNEEAFNFVNDLHQELFDEPRYSDYNSFKRVQTYYSKKTKK